jgi:phosphate transport system substrate-binding protein
MNMKKIIVSALALTSVLSLNAAQKLVIKGSDTLGAKMVPQLAEAFKAKNPGVVFEIAAEGSTTGIAAIIDSTADIGMSSRRAKPGEMTAAVAKGVTMKPTIVSYDAMAVIVNASNPISDMTLRQVEQVFSGDVSDWSALGQRPGKFSIYTRNTASGTYQDFQTLGMSKRDYAGSAQKMAGNEQIASEVAKNPTGIGYVGLAYSKTPGVKVVSIDGVFPSVDTANDKSYPLARPNFYYTNGTATGLAADFIAFTLSAEGQKVVDAVGFVPLQSK